LYFLLGDKGSFLGVKKVVLRNECTMKGGRVGYREVELRKRVGCS
jgi:hypothetical protein